MSDVEKEVPENTTEEAKAPEINTEEAKPEQQPAADAGKTAQPAQEEIEITVPEGAELDTEVLSGYKEVVKELGLSKEQAQKLVDKMAPLMASRTVEVVEKQREAWKEESLKDPEIGGEKLEKTLAVAKRGLEAVASPKLRQLLSESGLGNHPEVIKAFAKVGAFVGEDGKIVTGGPAADEKLPLEKRLYNKSKLA